MKIKIIDFGLKEGYEPRRVYSNDAGADVYIKEEAIIPHGKTEKIPLGFGLEIPDGYAGFIFPRSGMSLRGLLCELPPIDPSYRGEIHAIVSNQSYELRVIPEGTRIGQLVIMPVVIADFVKEKDDGRGQGAFGSTGEK